MTSEKFPMKLEDRTQVWAIHQSLSSLKPSSVCRLQAPKLFVGAASVKTKAMLTAENVPALKLFFFCYKTDHKGRSACFSISLQTRLCS